LRERLIEAAPETWLKIIQGEKDKLKALGLKPTVNVTGAGQQIAHNITESVKPDPVKEMRERIRHIRTPEELKAIQDSIGR
jgi:hypothetical protein